MEPPSGGDVSLTAPVDGVVRATAWPYTGQPVAAGDDVGDAHSERADRSAAWPNSRRRCVELEALAEAAVARLERLESLLAREAVSRREVEQARAEATGLEARLEAVQAELAGAEAARQGRGGVPGLGIKAPFAGRVAEVLVSPGEHVDAGTTLLRVVRERPVWIRVALIPEDSALLDGRDRRSHPRHRRDVRALSRCPRTTFGWSPSLRRSTRARGRSTPSSRCERSVDELKPGLRATAQILLPGEIEGVVLPDSAVIDDAGVSVVYVQLEW